MSDSLLTHIYCYRKHFSSLNGATCKIWPPSSTNMWGRGIMTANCCPHRLCLKTIAVKSVSAKQKTASSDKNKSCCVPKIQIVFKTVEEESQYVSPDHRLVNDVTESMTYELIASEDRSESKKSLWKVVTSVFTVKKWSPTIKRRLLEWSLVYQSTRHGQEQQRLILMLITHINWSDLQQKTVNKAGWCHRANKPP